MGFRVWFHFFCPILLYFLVFRAQNSHDILVSVFSYYSCSCSSHICTGKYNSWFNKTRSYRALVFLPVFQRAPRGVCVQLYLCMASFCPSYCLYYLHKSNILLCMITRVTKSFRLGSTVAQHVHATPAHESGSEQHLSETNTCKREENQTRA